MRALGNALHIVDEAHIEHTVGFIENQPASFRQIDAVFADQIGQTTRRCNKNVHTTLHTLDLAQT
ncbi:hypothetical protein D3C80_1993440 [compost metagenome]